MSENKFVVNNEGNIFLDRDGSTFLAMINYLRYDLKDMPTFENKI